MIVEYTTFVFDFPPQSLGLRNFSHIGIIANKPSHPPILSWRTLSFTSSTVHHDANWRPHQLHNLFCNPTPTDTMLGVCNYFLYDSFCSVGSAKLHSHVSFHDSWALTQSTFHILRNPVFIHSFIYSHYPRVQLPAASHYVLLLLSVFYFLCRIFQLASLVLSSSAFYSMVQTSLCS